MIKGIVGYTAEKKGKEVLLERSYGTFNDTLLVSTWEQAAEFLTEDKGEAFHITWNLAEFTEVVLSLLPKDEQERLKSETRIFYGRSKIFSVDRFFGVRFDKPLQGNIVDRVENNFFGILPFMPKEAKTPENAKEVALCGDDVLSGFERMGIYPTKLTSPVGVFEEELTRYKLPTIFTDESIIDACGYCIPMMGYEWWSAFKLGYFPQVYSYDMVSAYPSVIANLPDTDELKIEFRDTYIHTDWAIIKGEIEVWADISPIVYDTTESNINPKGKWVGYFTKEEINWLLKRKLGSFKLIDGYFIDFLTPRKPYREPITKLFALRNEEDTMVNHLAKAIGQGVSGKLDQCNQDGKLGKLYNPILAAMTRSRCRLAVADFVYDNDLLDDLLAIQVDGCEVLKEVEVVNNGKMGSWRLDGVIPALILSRNEVWMPDKKPLVVAMDDVLDAMKAHPNLSSYTMAEGQVIDLAGMELGNDRLYERYPHTGKEALTKTTDSKPIEVIRETGDNA